MEANQFLGILKFFHNAEYMEKLLDGFMHCQPPEIFRLSAQEGQGDRNESCTMSWRRARNDADILITINGHTAAPEDVIAMTVQHEGGDSWLSCWFTLRLPAEVSDLEKLKEDLTRMKREFGQHFIFIPAVHVREFIDRLKKASTIPVWAQEVIYEEDSGLWSSRCKSPAYGYQREYRAGFGQCEVHEIEPYTFQVDGGFRDIMFSDVSVQLTHQETGEVFLELLDL